MYADRVEIIKELEAKRNSKILLYVTGDRKGMETQLHVEVLDYFIHHLDLLDGDVEKISLVLHTRGGNTNAAWTLVNLIEQFCDKLEVIVPSKAHSAGTLMCLGAKTILMTKQATLGPIDPSVTTPLNPAIPGAPPGAKASVSVESIGGFLDFAKDALGEDSPGVAEAFMKLAGAVHPLVLGDAYRARSQIRMLAGRLLKKGNNEVNQEPILDFLCSESGSHDYTINRREADELGLHVEKPDDEQYELINRLFEDVRTELKLSEPFEPNILLGAENAVEYDIPRALVESTAGGTHSFRSKGKLQKIQIPTEPGVLKVGFQDTRTSEGWQHDAPQ